MYIWLIIIHLKNAVSLKYDQIIPLQKVPENYCIDLQCDKLYNVAEIIPHLG